MSSQEQSAWHRPRRRLAAIAVLIALLTALAGALSLGTHGQLYGIAYVAIAIMAVFTPSWIPAQVVAGELLAAMSLFAPNRLALLTIVGMIAGVIASAELLAAIARMDLPLDGGTANAMRRSAFAAVAGGSTFVAVTLVARLPGPSGLFAVTSASAACVLLALLLVGSRHA